jgi:hypothetical protein
LGKCWWKWYGSLMIRSIIRESQSKKNTKINKRKTWEVGELMASEQQILRKQGTKQK